MGLFQFNLPAPCCSPKTSAPFTSRALTTKSTR